MNISLFKKSAIALSVVTLSATVGVGSAQALSVPLPFNLGHVVALGHHGHDGDHHRGYSKDQCKNDGWKNFKNPDGSQKFKNQGQCIAFFNHQDHDGHGHDHGHDHDNDHGHGH